MIFVFLLLYQSLEKLIYRGEGRDIEQYNLKIKNRSVSSPRKGEVLINNMMDFNVLSRNKIPGQRFYLTKEGLEKIKKEYQILRSIKLSKTKGETPQFLHSDELNPEYFDFQDNMSLLETRIIDLKYIIENAELIKAPPKAKQNTIQLGAKVLVDVDGQKDEFIIVGTLESNPSLGMISNESPVGRAFLGHKVGENIVISSPIKTYYKIKKIRYS